MTGPLNADSTRSSSPLRQESDEQRSDFLEGVLRNAPYAIAVFDIRLRFLATNPRFLSENGLEAVNLVGKGLTEVFPNLPVKWARQYERSLEGETVIHDYHENQNPRNDSLIRRISLPWFSADGATGGIVVYDEDITEQKQTESRLNDKLEDLERFNNLSVERELRMRDLKKEINALLEELRRSPKYTISE